MELFSIIKWCIITMMMMMMMMMMTRVMTMVSNTYETKQLCAAATSVLLSTE